MSELRQRSTGPRVWNMPVCTGCDEIMEMCGCEKDFDGNEPEFIEVEVMLVADHMAFLKELNEQMTTQHAEQMQALDALAAKLKEGSR